MSACARWIGFLRSTDVVQTLYESSAPRSGERLIQFSFATKLVHMASPRLPIYDSRVVEVYFFQVPREPDLQELVRSYGVCAVMLLGHAVKVSPKFLPFDDSEGRVQCVQFRNLDVLGILIGCFAVEECRAAADVVSLCSSIVDNVRKVTEPLFMLFDFMKFDEKVYEGIVRDFVSGRAT